MVQFVQHQPSLSFFSILLQQIVKILSVLNQFYKLIVDLILNNLPIPSLNFYYSCTGSRSLVLFENNFIHNSKWFYAKAQLILHTQPTWIIIVGFDGKYIVLNNSKRIFPSVFHCSSTTIRCIPSAILFVTTNWKF